MDGCKLGGVSPAAKVQMFPPRSGTIAPLGGSCWLMLGYFFDVFLMLLLTSVLMAFDIDFRGYLASKIDPKSVQNRFKSRSKPIENLILFLIPLCFDFWWILAPSSTPWNHNFHWKTNGFLMILVFSRVTVFIALGSQHGSILGAFWVSSGVQNPSKIDFKPIPTTYQKKIAFWIALGTDFGRFLVPTWLHVGPKLAPSWAKLAPSWPSSWFKIQVGRTSPQLGRTWLHPGPNLALLGSFLEPTWLQLGSKIQPKSVQNRSKSPKMASRHLQEGLGTDLGGFL